MKYAGSDRMEVWGIKKFRKVEFYFCTPVFVTMKLSSMSVIYSHSQNVQL